MTGRSKIIRSMDSQSAGQSMRTSKFGHLPGRGVRMPAVRRKEAALYLIAAVLGSSVAMAEPSPRLPSAREIEFADEKVNSLNLDVSIGAIQSDNISRVSTNEEDGTVAIGGLNLKFRENTRRLQADVDADLGYEHYLDDESEDGVIGQARGVVTVGL